MHLLIVYLHETRYPVSLGSSRNIFFQFIDAFWYVVSIDNEKEILRTDPRDSPYFNSFGSQLI